LRRLSPFGELLVPLAAAALVFTSSAAQAGPPTDAELTHAREQFNAARKLEDAGRWAEALSIFQGVAAVKMTPQVRFHIALCMENVGLWTQALEGHAQAATEGAGVAPEVVKEANEHMRKLEAAIPTVSLPVQGAAPGDELYLDERRLSLDERPLPVRADPGAHTAEVRRGGAVVARERFALDPKSTRRIELKVGGVATGPAPGPQQPAPGGDRKVQRALGWTAVGLGAASAVLTGVFIGLRAGAMSRLEAGCPALMQCPISVDPIVQEGKRDAVMVNVFSVLTGVATAAGVVLLLTAPSPAPAATGRGSSVSAGSPAGGPASAGSPAGGPASAGSPAGGPASAGSPVGGPVSAAWITIGVNGRALGLSVQGVF
jgi:hypothetical protein